MNRSLLLVLGALACACAGASSQRATPSPAPAAPGVDQAPIELAGHTFHRRLLANGLQAFAVRDEEDRSSASVFMVVGVGTGHEGAGETGLAHLVEHAMYAGTARVGTDEHDAIVEDELGGESNAFTRQDYTLYYDHEVPLGAVGRVLDLEADRLRGLTLPEDAVLHERYRLEVEERRAMLDEVLNELVESVVFRAHPYGAGVRDADGHTLARRLRVADVRAFYDRWYHPNRTAVVVVGDLAPDAALDAVEQAFGGLPAGPPPEPWPEEPDTARGGEARFLTDLTRERVVHAWVVPPAGGEGSVVRAGLAVAARLVEDDEVSAGVGGRRGPDLFTLEATGEGAADLLEAARARLVEGSYTDEELARAVEGGARLEELTLRGRPYLSLAAELGVLAATGRLGELAADALPAPGRDELRALAERWLDPERRWTVRFLPDANASEEPLPEEPGELLELAQRADASGDLPRAIAAYEKLLETGPNRMNTVIYLYSLGDLRRRDGDLEGARDDLQRALDVVDYPAVRELLETVEAELAGSGGGEESAPEPVEAATPQAEPAPAAAGPARGVRIVPLGEIDAAWIDQAEGILAEIEAWRGLEFLEDLTVEVVPEDEAPEKLRGWYEPDTDRLVVVDGSGDTFARGTFLHELVHALQDQHFDLSEGRPEPGTDAARAFQALVEGEAMLAVSELMDYDFEQHTGLPEEGELDEERYLKIFHYGAGLRFVRALRDAGGWAQVDRAYAQPPVSTAGVLHPDRFLAGIDRVEVDFDALVEGAADGARRVRGEYELALLLARDPRSRAESARVAGRLAGDLEWSGELAGAPARRWALRFHDALGADAAETLLREGGHAVRRAGEVDLVVELPLEPESAEEAPGEEPTAAEPTAAEAGES